MQAHSKVEDHPPRSGQGLESPTSLGLHRHGNGRWGGFGGFICRWRG